jgi:hypothetical protein
VARPAPAHDFDALLLGRYRPLEPLGSGGSGSVWLARDEQSGRRVTVKIVPREGKPGSRARREAQAMASLQHPACLRAYACGRDAQSVYIAYEYVPGRTLREALRAGELRDDDVVEAAAQVLEGLAHAHARGIVHRDVKPANVLLADGDGVSVRLLDFGLARFAEADTLTAAGDVPGTLAYIAPERLHGDPASTAGDVWSVGVVLHEALAGRHPFWRPSLAETADAIAGGAPPLAELRPDLPQPLLAAVDRALSLEPGRRPSAAKLANALRRGRDGGARVDSPTEVARRVLPPALGGVYAGAAAAMLPFYPAHWAGALAALVAALAFVRPRAGLAAALAVPLLPLGNVALALAVLYAAVALGWFVLHAREPERGLLAPVGLVPGALPLVYAGARSPLVRGLGAAGAVLFFAAARSIHEAGGIRLPVAGSRAPLTVARDVAAAIPPALAVEAVGLAVAAVVLPWVAPRGRWWIAAWGAATISLAVLPVPALPLLLGAWITVGALWART